MGSFYTKRQSVCCLVCEREGLSIRIYEMLQLLYINCARNRIQERNFMGTTYVSETLDRYLYTYSILETHIFHFIRDNNLIILNESLQTVYFN